MPSRSSSRLALAFDLGTTTLAGSLLDLADGQRLATAGSRNPQREFGADVVARLTAADHSDGEREELTRLLRDEVWRLADELLAAAGVGRAAVARLALAGNPAIEHFLLGLPVNRLVRPPFRPLNTAGTTLPTTELGWSEAAEAYVFPQPGGFVGGDLVAFLYGQGLHQSPIPNPQSRLYLDLGTNGELALAAEGRLYATSAAAGPAFEGGNLACGMAALPGAVSDVRVEGERLLLTTLGDETPVGLCGSGVLAALAALLGAGVLDPTGRLREPAEIASNLANRLGEVGGERVFTLHRDARCHVYLSQEDIRQVQLAKAAIRAGIEVLGERSGVRCEALAEVILTGSFGAVLAPAHLISLGILPANMVENIRFVREGALAGVERSLLAPAGCAEVEGLAAALQIIPLSGTPAFEQHFFRQMNFPG